MHGCIHAYKPDTPCADFVCKYLAHEATKEKKPEAPQPDLVPIPQPSSQSLDVPRSFDQRYMINFSVVPDPQAMQVKGKKLTAQYSHPAMQEFRRVLQVRSVGIQCILTQNPSLNCSGPVQLYLDFRAKKSVQHVKKISFDRMMLPIAGRKDEILQSVRSCNVMLVAGDTGSYAKCWYAYVNERAITTNQGLNLARNRMREVHTASTVPARIELHEDCVYPTSANIGYVTMQTCRVRDV
jgi:hypothetical protein